MKCLYECLNKEWFKTTLETAKTLEGENAISYLLGMRQALRYRAMWDLTAKEERGYLYLITRELGRKRK